MRVFVLGAGGREHALVWRLRRDPDVTDLLAAPGNPGISGLARCLPVDLARPADVLALAERERVDLTVVGPEAPLELGLANLFREAGRAIVGPSATGAALECSKAFAKDFMARHRVPTARFRVCATSADARAAISGAEFGFPVVIKADGLAGGKGVVIAEDRREAEAAVHAAMVDRQFGAAGARVVVEECLRGPEVSLFVLTDGEHATLLGTAQDHKRIGDDDRGPNTGGMGAFAPSPLMTAELEARVMREIVMPVIDGMRAEGDGYRGFLYAGLMLTDDGPKVIEFNVRFGDPEAQVVMPILEGDFARALHASATEGLAAVELRAGSDRVVGVVLASRGYPGSVETGHEIRGLAAAAARPDVLVFHAGTHADDGRIVTAGGRVLTVVGRGDSFAAAMATAYAGASDISFEGMTFRRDIGRKAISSEDKNR